jgi:hypothetical protein
MSSASYAIPIVCIIIWIYNEKKTKNKSWSQLIPPLTIALLVVVAFFLIRFLFFKK